MQPRTSSSAGLARVEVLSERQAQSLQTLQRQLTKVQLKTRLMGHDVRPTLRKVSKPAVTKAVKGLKLVRCYFAVELQCLRQLALWKGQAWCPLILSATCYAGMIKQFKQ